MGDREIEIEAETELKTEIDRDRDKYKYIYCILLMFPSTVLAFIRSDALMERRSEGVHVSVGC